MIERRIWKFPIPAADGFSIFMPAGAHLLTVQTQGDAAYVWAVVDPAALMEEVAFVLVGTGHALREPLGEYVGTVQLFDGRFVGHLWRVPARGSS